MKDGQSAQPGSLAFERRLTRRRLMQRTIGVAASVPLLSLLAACGGDDDDDSSDSQPTATTASSAAPTATTAAPAEPTATTAAAEPTATTAASTGDGVFPATVEHKYGSIVIESAPTRIVTIGYNDQDHVLAFGITPIASRYWYGDESNVIFPWAEAALTGPAPDVLTMVELDFELIATYKPDLIVAIYSGITEDDYATLSQIAPTVAQLADYIDYGMPWEATTRLVGAALGMPERAEELIAGVEAQFEAAQTEHPELTGASVVVAAMSDNGDLGLFADEDGRTRIITGLGLEVLPNIMQLFDGTSFYTNLSGERINEIDEADVVVWVQVVWVGREVMEENTLYQQLRVYREGRHVYVEGSVDDAMAFNSVLSLPYALESLVPHLVAALDGDPDTNAPQMV